MQSKETKNSSLPMTSTQATKKSRNGLAGSSKFFKVEKGKRTIAEQGGKTFKASEFTLAA